MPSATSSEATTPSIRARLAWFAVLAAIVGACYGHVVTAFFVADDFNVLNVVHSATTVREATGIAAGWEFFRPLTAITYWWTYLVFGLEPAAFRAFDLACHAVNAWLVGLLAWQVYPSRVGAAFAGACFAALPSNAECVAWIAGRFDVLCVTGGLLCLTGWIDFARRGGAGAFARAVTGLAIGLLAKDTGMILPALLVCLSFAPWNLRSFRPMRTGLVVLLVSFAAYFAVRWWVLGGFGGYREGSGSAHLKIDLANAFGFLRDAVRGVFAPGTYLVQSLATLALVLSMWLSRPDRRTLLARVWPLLACFVIALAPAANTVILDTETGEGSRFLYLPAVFFCAMVGVVFGTGADAGRSRGLLVAGALLLASYAFTLVQTNRHWREAGDISREILAQLDRMLEGRSFKYLFIHDLPDHHRGAFVFRNGFENALSLFVRTPIEFPAHGRVSRAHWEEYAAKRRADPGAYPEFLLLRWMPGQRRFVTP